MWQTSESFEREKKWLEHSFLAVTSAALTLEGKAMYMLAKLMANVTKQRLYLLWNLCDLLDIINVTGKVDVTDTLYQNFKKLLTFLNYMIS